MVFMLACELEPELGGFGPVSSTSEAFGSTLLVPPLQPEAPKKPSLPPLRIATWNLRWLHALDGHGPVPRTASDYTRLAAYARRLDADVIALQEIDGPEAARRLLDPDAYRFHFVDHGTAQQVGFAWRHGVPVVATGRVDALAGDGLRPGVTIDLQLASRRIVLLGVHLKSGCAHPSQTTGAACERLFVQADRIADWLEARKSEGADLMMIGDFNRHFAGNGEFWTRMERGASLVDLAGGLRATCWAAIDGRFVDRFVFDTPAARWLRPGPVTQWTYDIDDAPSLPSLSDHCPLSVELHPAG